MPLTPVISQNSQKSVLYRTRTMRFGNGYEQRAADGTNPIEDSWTISWENVPTTDKNTILTALNTVQGFDYLTWTPPDETAKKFVVDGQVSISNNSGGIWTVSVAVRQVRDL